MSTDNTLGLKIKDLLFSARVKAKESSNGTVFICCPFHEEKSPSCSVIIQKEGFRPGTFYCFGCGAKGSWERLATALGIKNPFNKNDFHTLELPLLSNHSDDLLRIEENTVEQFLDSQDFIYTDWPENEPWRGVSYEFLKTIEAKMIYEMDEQKIFLPVRLNGVVVGGIRSHIDRKGYYTTKGNWVKTKGLFPFDLTKKLINQSYWSKKFVFLVEGPRDAARLLEHKIPALAILGTNMWNEGKCKLLASLCSEDLEVIVALDGDQAGQRAQKKIVADLKNYFSVKVLKLPQFSTENGKIIKCDLFNLGAKKFQRLLSTIHKKYGKGV